MVFYTQYIANKAYSLTDAKRNDYLYRRTWVY